MAFVQAARTASTDSGLATMVATTTTGMGELLDELHDVEARQLSTLLMGSLATNIGIDL
jgi:hypothetical protein